MSGDHDAATRFVLKNLDNALDDETGLSSAGRTEDHIRKRISRAVDDVFDRCHLLFVGGDLEIEELEFFDWLSVVSFTQNRLLLEIVKVTTEIVLVDHVESMEACAKCDLVRNETDAIAFPSIQLLNDTKNLS